MNIDSVQLITTTTTVGKGANDGTYPPGGLLTIAQAVTRAFPSMRVCIHDQHHGEVDIDPGADVVGIQVASTLCYKNALAFAQKAHALGKIVVLGGPHATALHERIMHNRPYVDCLIRGKGEIPFISLLRALRRNSSIGEIPRLSWRDRGRVVHNMDHDAETWSFDEYTPLPLHLLAPGVGTYWDAFRKESKRDVAAAFLLFTHFGCGYRQRRLKATAGGAGVVSNQQTGFCSFCSLDDSPVARNVQSILAEIQHYIVHYHIPRGSKVHLKCYGDNAATQVQLFEELADAIAACPWWSDYVFEWTFYCQSSYLNERLAHLLKRVGATHLYIGFDGVNNAVQRMNGLGTSRATHERAVELCLKHGFKIQAGSVVGLMGDTPDSLEELYQFFCRLLAHPGLLDRINSAILFVIPHTPAYQLLCSREPHLAELDLLPTTAVRKLWIKHFCPRVSLELLEEYANRIDELSPGQHASMGFRSSRLQAEQSG